MFSRFNKIATINSLCSSKLNHIDVNTNKINSLLLIPYSTSSDDTKTESNF